MAKGTIVLKADGSDVVKTVNQINQSLKGMAKTAQVQATAMNRAMSGIQSSISGLKASFVGLFAAGAVIGGIKQATQLWGVQEQAIISLDAALATAGRTANNASKALQDNASALQAVTTQGDEAIIQATAKLATFSKNLDVEQLKQAQQALVALADTRFGGNLDAAATALGKTLATSTNALGRYGVEVKATASEQDKLAAILKVTNPLFEQSKALAESTAGKQQQLSNAFGDLQETIGRVTLEMVGYNEGLGDTTSAIQSFDKALQDSREFLVRFAQTTRLVLGLIPNLAKVAVGSVAAALHSSMAMTAQAINGILAQISQAMQKLPVPDFLKKGAVGVHGFGLNFQAMATKDSNLAGDIARQGLKDIQKDWSRLTSPLPSLGSRLPLPPPTGGDGEGKGGGKGGSRGRAGGSRGGASAEKAFVAERIDPMSDYIANLFSRSQAIIESLKTPLDTFNEQVAELDLLAKNNLISFDQFNAKLAEYRQELDATLPASEALTGSWEEYTNAIGSTSNAMNDLQQVTVNVGTEFANMVATGKVSFADLTSSLLRDITRVIIQLKVVTPLMNSLFGAQGQGGGLLSQLGAIAGNAFKGFAMPTIRGLPTGGGGIGAPIPPIPRVGGGAVNSGVSYLVGERRPEVFVPDSNGRILPDLGKLGAGGSNVTVNVIGAPEGTKVRESQAGGQRMIDVIINEVAGQINRGQGAIPKAMSSRFGVNPSRGLA